MRKKGQEAFYKSKKWRKCRDTYLSEHPYCERCMKAGKVVAAVHVHHKHYLQEGDYDNPMVALNPDLLESLCFNCHEKEHHGAQDVEPDLMFDEDGNLVYRGDADPEKQPGA